jgi:hypothetical protein
VLTKLLVSAAIAAGCWVGMAVPAGAEPEPSGEQNPFGSLTCNCVRPAPPDSGALTDEINLGLLHGHGGAG